MKVKFIVQTKDSVKSKEEGKAIYFEVGKEYEIIDISRVDKITSNGWGKVVSNPIKKAEEVKEEVNDTEKFEEVKEKRTRKPKE